MLHAVSTASSSARTDANPRELLTDVVVTVDVVS